MAVAHRQWEAEPRAWRRPLPRFAWRWPALFTAAIGLLTLPPILLAALRIPSGSVFPGYLVIARDAYVYQSMWRAGWPGAWLFHPAYTAEMLPGILLSPWYLWPAHLVGWASGPWLYHLARLLAAAALLAAVALLIRELFRPRLLRRWAFVLCVLGGGVGALLPRDLQLGPFTTHATEMSAPGSSVADIISMAPHLPWAMALMCATMVVALRLRRAATPRLVAGGLIAIAAWRGRLRGDLLLPALWIVGMTLFMFAPGISGTLGRSFMASSVPFGLCATAGLLVLLRRLRTARWRRRVLAITLASSSVFGLVSLAQPYWIAAFRLDPHAEYESRAEAALLERLAPQVSARDVVLTTYLDGIFVPAQTGARAFVGHPEMTIDAPRKSEQALAFFSRLSASERATFLRANGIDYVLVTDPHFVVRLLADPSLRLTDHEGEATTFRVGS